MHCAFSFWPGRDRKSTRLNSSHIFFFNDTATTEIYTLSLHDALPIWPGSAVLKMAERAGGNPFLLAELLSGLREEQLVGFESGRAELAESRLPRRVSESLRRQLELMSDSARQVATVAAALGRRFSLSDLAVMLDVSASALLAPVEELIHAGMLVERGDKLCFGYDLTFEAGRGCVPPPVRRAPRRQGAGVLLADGN